MGGRPRGNRVRAPGSLLLGPPRQTGYQAPRQGGYQAPREGGDRAPRLDGHRAPPWTGYQAPGQGGYQAPPRSDHQVRSRPARRPGIRAAAALVGLVLAAAGAVTAFRAASGGPLTGGATTVPSTVRTAAPPMTAQAAAALAPSPPARIIIPSLRVDAPVMRLGLAADGSIEVPPLANHNLAGWYDRSVTPGQDGTSIILGHVDSYTGSSVFYFIKDLTRGDLVKVVRANGSTATFSVDGVQEVAKATFPSGEVYGNTRYPGLRLITCGGPFDSATRQYLDNVVVYAHLVS